MVIEVKTNDLEANIETGISSLIEEMGYRMVRIQMFKKTLQIMIERADEQPITVNDCEKVSRAVSVHLDDMDCIVSRYNLEISSPGINRPLVKPKDFIKFCGKHIVVHTFIIKNKRKTFKGILENASEYGIKLKIDSQLLEDCNTIDLLYEEIDRKSTRLNSSHS
jgi:ribosome maturation factor RimP